MRTFLASLLLCLGVSTSPVSVAAETAIFAGGCFWCTESDFEHLPGVISAVSGYTGGAEANPSYEQVSNYKTGHTEAVLVTFDPKKVTYSALVEAFWRTIDPSVKDQQFCDHGPQYRTAIFPLTPAQQQLADASKANLVKTARFAKVYTEVSPAQTFYPAEDYHQDYYRKNPVRYAYYRRGCGRDARLAEIWK